MLTRWLLASVMAAAILPAVACVEPSYQNSNPSADGGAPATDEGDQDKSKKAARVSTDPLDGFPTGEESLAKVCAEGANDVTTAALCAKPTPTISGLADLERLLGLDFKKPSAGNGQGGNPAFALNSNSAALSGRYVSAINPAVILFSPQRTRRFVSTMFVRGEPFVEITSFDEKSNRFVFYLVHFEQACDADKSCNNGDRLTGNLEKGWTKWSIYRDEDLADTTLDCLHCHQPGGNKAPVILRLQERVLPWTHWMGQIDANSRALVDDFEAAHPDETFGTIPPGLAAASDAAILEGVINTFGPNPQPNEFDSPTINSELRGNLGGGGRFPPQQGPTDDTTGTSRTWKAIYETAVAGKAIPVPYHHAKVTDPTKLSAMTDAYRSCLVGQTSGDKLPHIRDVLLDSALPDMGLRPKEGLDGKGILVQMCSQCHNSTVDPGLVKSHFDATKLDSLDPGTKSMAIARMQLDPKDVKHMPPDRIKILDGAALQLAIDFLKK